MLTQAAVREGIIRAVTGGHDALYNGGIIRKFTVSPWRAGAFVSKPKKQMNRIHKREKSSIRGGTNVYISRADVRSAAGRSYDGIDRCENVEITQIQPVTQSIVVKDNITTLGSHTTCGSGILQKHQSPFQADVVTRLCDGTASIIGKTNLDEFGMGSHSTNSFFGGVRNSPPFEEFSVGGSSGGSAVAIASGECDVGLGTDTGGSVRLPAAYTGIFGFKPSYGMVSRWGVIPYANSLDTVGFLGSSSKDIQSLFVSAAQHDAGDPTSITKSTRQRIDHQRKAFREGRQREIQRIGVPVEYNIEELDLGVRQAWKAILQLLQEAGFSIVPISLPNTKHALSAYYILAPAEAASNLAKYDGVRYGSRAEASDGTGDVLYSTTRGQGFGDEVKRRILLGAYTLSSEAINNYFIKAQKIRRLVQRDFDRVFAMPNFLRQPEQFDLSDMDDSIPLNDKLGPFQVDFIICPTAPTSPPRLHTVSKQSPVDTYMNDIFTVPASLAGLPAISMPFPIPKESLKEGTPDFAGIQVVGQYGDDSAVLDMAKKIESLLSQSA